MRTVTFYIIYRYQTIRNITDLMTEALRRWNIWTRLFCRVSKGSTNSLRGGDIDDRAHEACEHSRRQDVPQGSAQRAQHVQHLLHHLHTGDLSRFKDVKDRAPS